MHNFLQERLVHSLGLSAQPTHPLRVVVGNGNEIACHHLCSVVDITIQNHVFTVDLHILSLCGADLVLGVQWLKSLGPILNDYNLLTMKFIHEGKSIELKGNIKAHSHTISPTQLRRIIQNNGASAFFHIRILDPDLPSNQPNTTSHPELTQILTKYSSLFQTPTTLPPSRNTNHAIHLLPNSNPINVRPYRYPYFQKQEIETQVASMLQNGIIRPNTSPFSSPVLLVKKRDGTWRFCVDYRALNAITVKDHFTIPTIDELLDELGGARWFSKLDLLQGYHQILMKPEDVDKTAFRTHHGHYEFLVMPFGLCNVPSSFQATMNNAFSPYLRKFIFFDDILIYSSSLSEHMNHLEHAFEVLLAGGFFLKLSKCSFAQNQIEYLGHIVSHADVHLVPAKIEAIRDYPTPYSIIALRTFLGLSGFYRRFIQGYALIVAPLTKLLAKDQFQWTPTAQQAFDKLKTALCSAPILGLPDFSQPFTVETNTSRVGMGAVLSQ